MNIQKLVTTDGAVLYEGPHPNVREAVEAALSRKIWLDNIDLRRTDLKNINLDSVHLRNADFSEADLSGANISESHLLGCIFRKTRLIDACLCYSDLLQCNFLEAEFSRTDISEARVDESLFSPEALKILDFRSVYNLTDLRFETRKVRKTKIHPKIATKILPKNEICQKDLSFRNIISEYEGEFLGSRLTG